MTVRELCRVLIPQYTGSHVVFQIEQQPILGVNRGHFVSLQLNDPRFEQILDIEVIAIGTSNNRVVIYV